MRVVDKNGKTVQLNDKNRTVLEKLPEIRAFKLAKRLNAHRPLSPLAPFKIADDL